MCYNIPTHFDGAQQSSERPSPASSRGNGEAFSDCLFVQRGYRYIKTAKTETQKWRSAREKFRPKIPIRSVTHDFLPRIDIRKGRSSISEPAGPRVLVFGQLFLFFFNTSCTVARAVEVESGTVFSFFSIDRHSRFKKKPCHSGTNRPSFTV